VARFVEDPVTVSVPATSANLGPGYDSLGLALDLRDRLTGEVTPSGLDVHVTGEGAGTVPLDESHLVVRAMRAAFAELGEQPPGLRLRCDNAIPHARGLGSSSAAIVGGIALARALVAGGTLVLDDDAAFRLAARLEGHPDNVAPAWYGGLVISGRDDDWYAVPTGVDPRVDVVLFVPPEPLSTEVARGLLPSTVPHADAAANAGRTALLVAALTSAPEHLLAATRDFLHQDYRRPAMPASLELVDTLRAEGVAAVVSGAGPSVLAFCAGCDANALVRRAPAGWAADRLQVDRAGVRVE
jgi:homoserine kinase